MSVPLFSLLTLLGATASATTSPEQEAYQAIASSFVEAKRSPPSLDPALSKAAQALAQAGLDGEVSDVTDVRAVTRAVSQAEGFDPNPRIFLVRGHPLAPTLESLAKRTDWAEEAATHVGIGTASNEERSAAVVLMSARKLRLLPFPRAIRKPGKAQTLCGELLAGLSRPEAFVTRPDGGVDRLSLSKDNGARFCVPVRFSKPGAYAIEVMGRGEGGPEVAGLFETWVGEPKAQPKKDPPFDEPDSAEAAQAAILSEINALRRSQKVGPVQLDNALSQIAQAYSRRMDAEKFFAHIAPDGSGVRERLRAADYSHQIAGENLGLASGPLGAHFGIEQSPGHRLNLLNPQFTRIGIGIHFARVNGRPRAILTEILAGLAQESTNPQADAYEALFKKRKELSVPKVLRSEPLERVAQQYAQLALQQDKPSAKLPGTDIHSQAVKAEPELALTVVDFLVAERPSLVGELKNLADRRLTHVGVGVVKGDSPSFGKGRYWICVVYGGVQ